MNQGTRTQQLAQYVVYESPLQYLTGTPSDYRAAPDFTRRSGDDWYLAAMTDWTARTFAVPLSFLPAGAYAATIVADGMNADRYAADYRIDTQEVRPDTTLTLRLAPGGGYVARMRKVD